MFQTATTSDIEIIELDAQAETLNHFLWAVLAPHARLLTHVVVKLVELLALADMWDFVRLELKINEYLTRGDPWAIFKAASQYNLVDLGRTALGRFTASSINKSFWHNMEGLSATWQNALLRCLFGDSPVLLLRRGLMVDGLSAIRHSLGDQIFIRMWRTRAAQPTVEITTSNATSRSWLLALIRKLNSCNKGC